MSAWDNDNSDDSDSLIMDFDTAAVEPQRAFEPLPAGKYPVAVRKVSVKPTKDGTGKRANFELVVLDGEHKGRVVFHGINVINKNEQAQIIGRGEIAGLLAALGISGEKDLAKTIGGEAIATLKVRPAANGYDASNEVKGYSPISGAAAAPQAAAPSTTPAATGAAPARKAPRFVG